MEYLKAILISAAAAWFFYFIDIRPLAALAAAISISCVGIFIGHSIWGRGLRR